MGAYQGWNEDRMAVQSALTAEGEMRTQLENRAMDAANLAVVAARHLEADNKDLAALRSASASLLASNGEAAAILQADAVITDVALRFAEELPGLPTVQASGRDKTYVSMLTSLLGKKRGLTHTYTLLVEDFNQRLEASLTGKLARLLGVAPLSMDLIK